MSTSSAVRDDRDASSGSADRREEKMTASRPRGAGRRKLRQIHAAATPEDFRPARIEVGSRRPRYQQPFRLASSATSSGASLRSLPRTSLRASAGAASCPSSRPCDLPDEAASDVEDDDASSASRASPDASCETEGTARRSNTARASARRYRKLYEAALADAMEGTGLGDIREERGAVTAEEKPAVRRVVNRSCHSRGSDDGGGSGDVVPFAVAVEESYIDGLQVQEVLLDEVTVAPAPAAVLVEEEGEDEEEDEEEEKDEDSLHLSASDESSADEGAAAYSGERGRARGEDAAIAPTRKNRSSARQSSSRSLRSGGSQRSERGEGDARDLRDRAFHIKRNSILVPNLSELQATPRKMSTPSVHSGDLHATSRRKSRTAAGSGGGRPRSRAGSPATTGGRRGRDRSGIRDDTSKNRDRSCSTTRSGSQSSVGSYHAGSVGSRGSRRSHRSDHDDPSRRSGRRGAARGGGGAPSRSLSRLRRTLSGSSRPEDADGASLLSEDRRSRDGASSLAASSDGSGARPPKKGLLRKVKKLAGKVKHTLEDIGGSLSGLHHYRVGERARYRVAKVPHCPDLYDPETGTVEVVIEAVKIDAVLETPYYAIRLPNGRTKQTAWDNLMTLSDYRKRAAAVAGGDASRGRDRGSSPIGRGRRRSSSRGPSGGGGAPSSSASRAGRGSRSRSAAPRGEDGGQRPARSASRTAPRSRSRSRARGAARPRSASSSSSRRRRPTCRGSSRGSRK